MGVTNLQNNKFARVTFSPRGLQYAFSKPSLISEQTPSAAANIVQFAALLQNVQITSSPPVQFKSIPEFYGVDYFGYIIDKERLDPVTGVWLRTDEYKIVGSQTNNFKDTRIAYGQTYRYRISTVTKVTTKVPKSNLSNYEIFNDIQTLQNQQLIQSSLENQGIISNLSNSLGKIVTKTLTGSQHATTIQLSDNTKLVYQNGQQSYQTVVQGNDTTFSRRSLKNLKASDSSLVTGNTSNVQLAQAQNKVLQSVPKDSQEFDYYSVYYQSKPSKYWEYITVVDNQLPPYPVSIIVTPNSTKNQIAVTWLAPPNPQRDTVSFNLYRRTKIGQNWHLLATKLTNNLYIDTKIDNKTQYIYALTTIDAHNLESYLSVQIGAQLNKNYSRDLEELPVVWYSGGGVRKDEVDLQLKKFQPFTSQIIAKKNIKLTVNTKFDEQQKNYLIKIKSLDTHATKEVVLQVKNNPILGPFR